MEEFTNRSNEQAGGQPQIQQQIQQTQTPQQQYQQPQYQQQYQQQYQPQYQQQYQYPQYGQPLYRQPEPAPEGAKGKAVASLVLGIVSLVFLWIPFLPLILAIIGVALGGSALKACPQGVDGHGLSVAGLVLSVIALSIIVIYTVLVLVLAGMSNSLYWWARML